MLVIPGTAQSYYEREEEEPVTQNSASNVSITVENLHPLWLLTLIMLLINYVDSSQYLDSNVTALYSLKSHLSFLPTFSLKSFHLVFHSAVTKAPEEAAQEASVDAAAAAVSMVFSR